MRIYRKFKTKENYKCEVCFRQVTNTPRGIILKKLRLSNHKIAIETGRYLRPNKKPEEICPICKLEMEDEYHFLTECPAYHQEKRNVLFDNLKNEHLIRVHKMSPNEIFMFLINLPRREAQKLIARHVFEYFKIRKEKEDKK